MYQENIRIVKHLQLCFLTCNTQQEIVNLRILQLETIGLLQTGLLPEQSFQEATCVTSIYSLQIHWTIICCIFTWCDNVYTAQWFAHLPLYAKILSSKSEQDINIPSVGHKVSYSQCQSQASKKESVLNQKCGSSCSGEPWETSEQPEEPLFRFSHDSLSCG